MLHKLKQDALIDQVLSRGNLSRWPNGSSMGMHSFHRFFRFHRLNFEARRVMDSSHQMLIS